VDLGGAVVVGGGQTAKEQLVEQVATFGDSSAGDFSEFMVAQDQVDLTGVAALQRAHGVHQLMRLVAPFLGVHRFAVDQFLEDQVTVGVVFEVSLAQRPCEAGEVTVEVADDHDLLDRIVQVDNRPFAARSAPEQRRGPSDQGQQFVGFQNHEERFAGLEGREKGIAGRRGATVADVRGFELDQA
jgi:hypothetical protein